MSDESPEFEPNDAATVARDRILECCSTDDEEHAQEAVDAISDLARWVPVVQRELVAAVARAELAETKCQGLQERVNLLQEKFGLLARADNALRAENEALKAAALAARQDAVPTPRTAASKTPPKSGAERARDFRRRRSEQRSQSSRPGVDQNGRNVRNVTRNADRNEPVTHPVTGNSPPQISDPDPQQDLDLKLFQSSALPDRSKIKKGEEILREAVTRTATASVTDVVTQDGSDDLEPTEPWLRLWDIWDTLNGGDLGRDQATPQRSRLEKAWPFCERRGAARGLPATAIFSEAAVRFLADPKTREKALGLEVMCTQLAALTSAAQLSGTALQDAERRDALIRKLKTELETVNTGINVVDALEQIQLQAKKARIEEQLANMGVAS